MSSRVKNMIENEYHEIEFPYHPAFGTLIILVKKG